MMNTIFRLLVLIPAALFSAFAALASLESGGLGFVPALFWAAISASALALIAWAIADHRHRARAKKEFNA